MYKWNDSIHPTNIVDTEEDSLRFRDVCLKRIADGKHIFAFDTETKGLKIPGVKKKILDWMNDTITFWSICWKEGEQYERFCLRGEHLHLFAPLLENPAATLLTWNGKYDAHVSFNSGINIWNANVIDALIAGHLFDENLQGRMSLKFRAAEWANFRMTKFAELFKGVTIDNDGNPIKIKEFETDLRVLPLNLVANYASLDAYATYKVWEFLETELLKIEVSPGSTTDQRTLLDHFFEVEVPVTRALWKMERRGLGLEAKRLSDIRPEVGEQIAALERKINKAAHRVLNINSTPQLQKFFYGTGENDLMLPVLVKTPGGKPSTNKEVLENFALDGIEVARNIIDYRKLMKFRSTYLDNLLALSDHFSDSRIHPNFNQYGARTGRFSTGDPNCYDDKTEVLTEKGWVLFKNLKGEHVAQWSQVEGMLFVKPTAYIAEEFAGELVALRGGGIDLLVTKNHRCPLIPKPNRVSSVIVYPADEYPLWGFHPYIKKEDTLEVGYTLTCRIERQIIPYTGKIYCVTVPSTLLIVRRNGKVCISGNSQNFPRPGNDVFELRKAFIPKPENALIVGDYKQLEMRIMAHFSRDPDMIKAIIGGMDLHCFTIAKMFGIPYELAFEAKQAENPTEEQKELVIKRQHAKTIGFGIIYGMGPKGLAEALGIAKESAAGLINNYLHQTFPGVGQYIEETQAFCASTGYVRTLVGRRRRLEDIDHSKFIKRAMAERESVNAVIQGSAGDIAKAAMIRVDIHPELREAGLWMINQIHDELVFEIRKDLAEWALEIIQDIMEHPFGDNTSLRVPLPVDIKIVPNWAEAK